ncbi:MAG: hypothetical protein KJO23_01515, partial [Bacteroidia bacterium]|nr:hypothetical protein [Bacteroidia bacterium]NNM24202.1 hypothetical protein [Flavobacteriaceae bacterium]
MKFPKNLPALLVLCLIGINSYAQGPGSLFVDAGPDVTADCASGGCADITATFLETFDTSGLSYQVNSISYNPPFPFNGLANPLNPNIDDAWSPVDNLPFDFCYFGDLETQFQVGSNGVIRFDVDPSDTTNGWSFSENLPNNTNPTLGEANVCSPVHDIDPSASTTEEIGYEVLGAFPNRVLVVSYYEVPMFSGACNSMLATQMMVFYEFSNVIEMYIQDKPSCTTWQNGATAIGIQNDAGDTAFVPPGRNTSDSPYTLTNEAWSFEPIGPPTYVFEWLDSMGNVIGTTPTINVCPAGSEVYTARVTWTNTCNGDVVVLTDDVTVSTLAPFAIDLGPDQNICGTDDVILDASPGAPAGAVYEWFFNAISQGAPSPANPTFTVMSPNSGTYSVQVYDPADPSCVVGDSVEINYFAPATGNPPMPLVVCDSDNDGFAEFDLTLADNDITGGDPDLVVTYHGTLLDAQNGVLPLPNPYTNDDIYNDSVWARVESMSSGCFDTVELFLIVRDSPVATTPADPLRMCDDSTPDGFTFFDLTVVEPEVLGGMDPTEFDIYYYVLQSDA